MLSFVRRIYTQGNTGPAEATDPADQELVISSNDAPEGFTELTVRPMTYAEVAGHGIGAKARVVTAAPRVKKAAPVQDAARIEVASQADCEDVYGDIADHAYRPRHKGHRRRPKRHQAH